MRELKDGLNELQVDYSVDQEGMDENAIDKETNCWKWKKKGWDLKNWKGTGKMQRKMKTMCG